MAKTLLVCTLLIVAAVMWSWCCWRTESDLPTGRQSCLSDVPFQCPAWISQHPNSKFYLHTRSIWQRGPQFPIRADNAQFLPVNTLTFVKTYSGQLIGNYWDFFKCIFKCHFKDKHIQNQWSWEPPSESTERRTNTLLGLFMWFLDNKSEIK